MKQSNSMQPPVPAVPAAIRHLVQAVSTVAQLADAAAKLTSDSLPVCNKVVTLALQRRSILLDAADADDSAAALDKALARVGELDAEIADWYAKVVSAVHLLVRMEQQSNHVKLAAAAHTAHTLLLNAQQASSRDPESAMVGGSMIRAARLAEMINEVLAMHAADLALKLQLAGTLDALALPLASDPATCGAQWDRAQLVTLLGHWMYAPPVRQAGVADLADAADALRRWMADAAAGAGAARE
ncbi:hypothetical protein H9P43_005923 [Blastocladiella emersonii ATCC 22665]|nr:hypothetical protein H9P43_005923 [Blastocladiella emersonii ATCC 22665]